MRSQVFFIGAGPGAADLITLRGARLLAQAEVVLFDALTDPALRELAPDAQWIDVGKRGFTHATRQTAINALLLRSAQQHARVVFRHVEVRRALHLVQQMHVVRQDAGGEQALA